jgi:hypothetical protein
VPHDHARAIRCLQDHQERPGFGQPCRKELAHHQEHAAIDYRRARARSSSMHLSGCSTTDGPACMLPSKLQLGSHM